MDLYKFFTVEDDSRYSMPVIRGYEYEIPLVARTGQVTFEGARDYLARELQETARTGPPHARSAAAGLLRRFDEVYASPKQTPGEMLQKARGGIRSLFEKHRATGEPSVFISEGLSVEAGAYREPGRVDVVLRPFGGVSLAFLERDIDFLRGLLNEAGFELPIPVHTTSACSLCIRLPVEQLCRVPPEFHTYWLNSRSR